MAGSGWSKIDGTTGGEQEVKRWYDEGRPFAWMVEEYDRKYNLQVTPTMFSNRAARRGWKGRTGRNDDIVPWRIDPRHENNNYLKMLRLVARQRKGLPLSERFQREVTTFLADMEAAGAVIYYDPETDEGFYAIPREPGDGDGLVRQPPKARRTARKARD